ncbi:MAG TPA: hypothetical protein VGV39_11445 [Mesorhizobium sp.]|uniref:hypothetical protein n=1 Tax=Mesorhizobium sp. TaxID=1871066 RepID=UPI002DDCF423|nr:hypothetical protein [Mesorhizobium sp.]HEV2503685.1 hypothetical protein [Mesorhizobium sp.]
MILTNPIRHTTRPPRQEAPAHLFAIGQAVRLKSGFARPTLPADTYRITGTLPARGVSPQYRIRNDDERHERVTTQDNLEPVDRLQSGNGATLIERTFRHG